jgi:8-oxo-dGTP pyrophosphatase MutT (NUDIX family)
MAEQRASFPHDIIPLGPVRNEPDETLSAELIRLIKPELCTTEQTYTDFIQRAHQGNLTRDEDSSSHFGVFILPRDVATGEVLIAFHKKANTWIFPGGHIEKGETTIQTLQREAGEELGLEIRDDSREPFFLSTVEIDNPKRPCKKHYDIWYAVDVSKEDLGQSISDEFTKTRWFKPDEALESDDVTDPSTREALLRLEAVK